MEIRELQLGYAIYEIQRSYQGDRPAAELILDKLAAEQVPITFDTGPGAVVE